MYRLQWSWDHSLFLEGGAGVRREGTGIPLLVISDVATVALIGGLAPPTELGFLDGDVLLPNKEQSKTTNIIINNRIVNKQDCKQRTLRRRIEVEFLSQFMYTAGGHWGAGGVQNFDHYFISPEGGSRGRGSFD